MDLTLGWESHDFSFCLRLDEEPALIQERECHERKIPCCSRGEPLKDSSEARRLREAWWFQRQFTVESR